jgi:hypothetical protein
VTRLQERLEQAIQEAQAAKHTPAAGEVGSACSPAGRPRSARHSLQLGGHACKVKGADNYDNESGSGSGGGVRVDEVGGCAIRRSLEELLTKLAGEGAQRSDLGARGGGACGQHVSLQKEEGKACLSLAEALQLVEAACARRQASSVLCCNCSLA